jgi:hypothetical protein
MHASSGEFEGVIELCKSYTDHLVHVVIAIGRQAGDYSGLSRNLQANHVLFDPIAFAI